MNVPTRIALARPITWLAAMIVLLWTGSSIAQDGAATLRATTLDGVDVTVPDLQRATIRSSSDSVEARESRCGPGGPISMESSPVRRSRP